MPDSSVSQSASQTTRHGKVSWKERRLGPGYAMGVQRRQVRVGREKEPVAVIRVLDDIPAGTELVLTRRDVRFIAIGIDYESRRSETLPRAERR